MTLYHRDQGGKRSFDSLGVETGRLEISTLLWGVEKSELVVLPTTTVLSVSDPLERVYGPKTRAVIPAPSISVGREGVKTWGVRVGSGRGPGLEIGVRGKRETPPFRTTSSRTYTKYKTSTSFTGKRRGPDGCGTG